MKGITGSEFVCITPISYYNPNLKYSFNFGFFNKGEGGGVDQIQIFEALIVYSMVNKDLTKEH